MCKNIFDYDDGDFIHSISDNMAIDSDGDFMIRMGDIHFISSWSDDDDED